MVVKAPALARSVDEQLEVIEQLRAEADHSYAEAVVRCRSRRRTGRCCAGRCWRGGMSSSAPGEFFRALEQKVSWLRDRLMAALKGEPPGAANLKVAVESGLESLLREESAAAAERAEASWQANSAGRALIESAEIDLSRPSADFDKRAARAIRDWQGAVLDLVADEGMSKRSRARFYALGVNWIGRGLDDRRLRTHRRLGRSRDRSGRRHRGARPTDLGGGLR